MAFSEAAGEGDDSGATELLATGGEDGTLRVWQLSAAKGRGGMGVGEGQAGDGLGDDGERSYLD